MSDAPMLRLRNLVKHFPLGGGVLSKPTALVRAVEDVSLDLQKGESFGLVGESGLPARPPWAG